MTVILALKSYWRQPISISRQTDRRQFGILLPVGVMIRDPSAGGGGNADTLQGQDGAYYLDRDNHTGSDQISDVTGLQDALDTLTNTDTDLQAQVDLKLDAADYNDRFLGLYASIFDLEAAHPTASAGDYAQVDLGIGTDVIVYAWDVSDSYWSAVGSSSIANTDALPEGSSNLYHTPQRVRDAPLTGLSVATAAPITAVDSVLAAAGKLQAQINASSQTRKFPVGFWANQHQSPSAESQIQQNTIISYMYFVLPHAMTISQIGYAFFTSQAGSQTISIRFYNFATGVAVTQQIDLTGGGYVTQGAITPINLAAGAYIVACKPSLVANFASIAAAACPLLPVADLRSTATAVQTVSSSASLPATFPSSGLSYNNSHHPAINFFVSG